MVSDDPSELAERASYGPMMGACGQIGVSLRRGPPPKREFNIGFHVAAPGPSHEDAPVRRRAPAKKATRR